MTVTEQGCAELAERLTKLSDCLADGRFEDNEADAITCHQAATILSRLTVEELAGVIARQLAITPAAIDRIASGHGKSIASALLDHITAETEV